jgi:hypothetical protein
MKHSHSLKGKLQIKLRREEEKHRREELFQNEL